MYDEVLFNLKRNNIKLEKGLTSLEIEGIESLYKIKFPQSLKNFLMFVLPVSQGFYNWRDRTSENIQLIKTVLEEPLRYIYEMPTEVYWSNNWGKEPKNESAYKEEIRSKLKMAPKLVPVYSHRYIPIIYDENNPPVISICGGDVIYMGENLEDYFDIEFGNKLQIEIEYSKILPIPFWSDLI